MRVLVSSDHAGFNLKRLLVSFLEEKGYDVYDCGPETLSVNDDYPDFIRPMARRVLEENPSFGIGIGASGQGEAIAANRIPGARAVVYYGDAHGQQQDADGTSLNLLQSTRAHNDANILCLGARFVSEDEAKRAVLLWLSTPFSGEARHARRIAQLDSTL